MQSKARLRNEAPVHWEIFLSPSGSEWQRSWARPFDFTPGSSFHKIRLLWASETPWHTGGFANCSEVFNIGELLKLDFAHHQVSKHAPAPEGFKRPCFRPSRFCFYFYFLKILFIYF